MSALRRCLYFKGREFTTFVISGTRRTVRNREVSVRRGYIVAGVRCNIIGEYFEKSLHLNKKQSQATEHLQENSAK